MTELDRYDYELPRHLIAQEPSRNRVDARLLVVNRSSGSLEHRYIRDLPEILKPNDCLVLNDTKVIPARLVGYRTKTLGRWEGLFIESSSEGFWHVIGQTRGRLTAGETLTLLDPAGEPSLLVELVRKEPDRSWIVKPHSTEETMTLLERVGRVPLPPYIRDGEMKEADRQTYQTVYAKTPGAVAAPTAGLHFTPPLLKKMEEQGVDLVYLTLHVGLGTFRPIAVESLDQHQMHSEWASLSSEAVERIKNRRKAGGRVVAVGTTSMRTLESAARDGVLKPFAGHTDLFIRPPYDFHAVDALLTNFHLPKTTLLVLVRTFGGDELIRRAYEEAIREEYRFYSYGDAMLIL